jgi:hypothetical protein
MDTDSPLTALVHRLRIRGKGKSNRLNPAADLVTYVSKFESRYVMLVRKQKFKASSESNSGNPQDYEYMVLVTAKLIQQIVMPTVADRCSHI